MSQDALAEAYGPAPKVNTLEDSFQAAQAIEKISMKVTLPAMNLFLAQPRSNAHSARRFEKVKCFSPNLMNWMIAEFLIKFIAPESAANDY